MKRLLLFLLIFTVYLSAQITEKNSSEEKILVGGDLGLTFTSSDYKEIGSGIIIRGVGEYFIFDSDLHRIGLRGYVGYGLSSGSDNRFSPEEFSTHLYMLAVGGVYTYKFTEQIEPYAFLGLRFLRFNPKDSDGNILPASTSESYDKNIFNIAIEFGLRYTFNEQLIGYSSLSPLTLTNDFIDARPSGNAKDFVVALNFGLLYSIDAPWSDDDQYFVEKRLPEGVAGEETIEESDFDDKPIEQEIIETEEDVEEIAEEAVEEAIEDEEDGIEIDADDTPVGIETEVDESKSNIVTELSKKLEVGTVHFDYGETELDRMEYVELDRMYDIIADTKKSRWKIVGYTDDVEPVEIHQSLGIQRAYFVMRYFMGKGVERSRFEVIVKGTEDPIGDNETSEGRAKNRRVEVIKIK